MNQRNTQIAIGVAVIVVVGLLAWWLFSKPVGKSDSMMSATSTATESTGIAAADTTDLSGAETAMVTDASMTTATNEAVSVSDQPAGDSVRVGSVTLAKTGWVAVRDAQRIYGAAWLTAGTHENVSVPLLRNTTSGSKYSVILYVDNGNKQFEMHADSMVTGVSGMFSATNGD
jgi:hypothetical protein